MSIHYQRSVVKRCSTLRQLTEKVKLGVNDAESKLLVSGLSYALVCYDDRKSIAALQVS